MYTAKIVQFVSARKLLFSPIALGVDMYFAEKTRPLWLKLINQLGLLSTQVWLSTRWCGSA